MLGGYQILDLTNIDLEITTSAEDITDSGVLKQLLNLREYIDENYDFTRPLNNKLKPLLIRLRDAEENEEIEASVWGNLSVTKDGFIISANVLQDPLLQLQLFVSFEKAYDDDGNAYWIIDDAKIMLSNSLNITGDLQAVNITGDSIIENMEGYSFIKAVSTTEVSADTIYAGVCKNGNKITFVVFLKISKLAAVNSRFILGQFVIPSQIADKLIPSTILGETVLNAEYLSILDETSVVEKKMLVLDYKDTPNNKIQFLAATGTLNALTQNNSNIIRIEHTYLLSYNMAS